MSKLIYCPYCRKEVNAGKIRWLWFFVFLVLMPYLLFYLIYCAVSRGRVCPECKRRIYPETRFEEKGKKRTPFVWMCR